jgi:hypothetical protein
MAAFTPALIGLSVAVDDSFCINPSGWTDNRVLAAGVAESITVPTDAVKVYISGTENYYVGFTRSGYDDVTAIVPNADTTSGLGFALNPTSRTLGGITKLSIISALACIISLEYYRA